MHKELPARKMWRRAKMERVQIELMCALTRRKAAIKTLAKQGQFDDALEKCGSRLADMPNSRAEVLRIRAYVYTLRGEYSKAAADRSEVIDSGHGILRDYYQIAENFLTLRHFAEASKWLQQVVKLGAEQNETWFDSAALLLLSYAQMQLGCLKEAAQYLDAAISKDPECAIPIRGQGIIDNRALRAEVTRRLQFHG